MMSGGVLAASRRRAAAPAYNPLTAVTWAKAFWASDPSWSNPGNGNGVSSWRNGGSIAGDATQATGSKQPTYAAAATHLNNRPAVDFDGVDDHLDVATFADITLGTELVVIARATAAASNNLVSGTVSGKRRNLLTNASSQWAIFAGTAVAGGTADTNGHFLHAIFTGSPAASTLAVDGSTVASGNAGSEAVNSIRLGANLALTVYLAGLIAFVGFGSLTVGERADLLAWSRDFYATP